MAKVIKDIKTNHYILAFYITLFVSVALIVGGFFCPPIGQVSGSVLTAAGILFLWPTLETARKAIEIGRSASIKTGNIEVNIDGKKEE